MTGTPSARIERPTSSFAQEPPVSAAPARAASALARSGDSAAVQATLGQAGNSKLSLATISERWSELPRQMLQSGLPLVAAALSDSTPTALVADALTLLTPPGRVAVLTDPEQQRLIVSGCIAVFGQRLRLVIRAGASSAGNNGQPAVTDERQRRYQAAQEHPVVKELMQRFSAELVERELVDLETWLARVAAEREQAPRRRLQGDVRSGYLAGAHETLGDG